MSGDGFTFYEARANQNARALRGNEHINRKTTLLCYSQAPDSGVQGKPGLSERSFATTPNEAPSRCYFDSRFARENFNPIPFFPRTTWGLLRTIDVDTVH